MLFFFLLFYHQDKRQPRAFEWNSFTEVSLTRQTHFFFFIEGVHQINSVRRWCITYVVDAINIIVRHLLSLVGEQTINLNTCKLSSCLLFCSPRESPESPSQSMPVDTGASEMVTTPSNTSEVQVKYILIVKAKIYTHHVMLWRLQQTSSSIVREILHYCSAWFYICG